MTYVRTPPAILLAQVKVFESLEEEALLILCEDAVACRYQADETIYLGGAPASHCLLLESGLVSLICYSERGDEYVRNQFGAGGLVGLPVMFMENRSYPATARADTVVLGYWISARSLEALCLTAPQAALSILRYTSGMLRSSLERHYSLATTQCAGRLAGYLLSLHDQAEQSELTVPMKIGQLANTLGMSSATLSRLLAQWRRQKLIAGRGVHISLLNVDGLRKLSTA